MATVTQTTDGLRNTDGFRVESPTAELGWVEEIWLDDADEPCALALQTKEGRHALLLGEQVVAVDRAQRWVVVPSGAQLLELSPPHLVTSGDSSVRGNGIVASWATTGELLEAPVAPPASWRRRLSDLRTTPRPHDRRERPLWQAVAALYGTIGLFLLLVITLAFVIARLASGHAY